MDSEDQVLDALIVAALRQIPTPPSTAEEIAALEVYLDAEDRRVLDARSETVVARVMERAKRRTPAQRQSERVEPQCSEALLAGAMNRGGDSGELTDKAREEMERRLRERLAQEEDPPDDERKRH
jgi:hypothetical protein